MALGTVRCDPAFASIVVARLATAVEQLGDGTNPLGRANRVLAAGPGGSLTPATPAATCTSDTR